jgi:predicted lipid-binding transport protein (Tim44 family)
MLRALLMAALLAGPAATLVPIQAASAAIAADNTKCADTPQKKARRSLFGGIASGMLGGMLGGSGVGSVAIAALPAASLLSDAIMKMLDCKEQQQAAKATDDALRGGVGTEVAWKSETRANVTGASKVTASEQLADGGSCMTVTDVVIVDGEETTVPKRMCRARGASGYARV